MDLTNEEIAVAFSKHDFEAALSYFPDQMQWDVVGGETLYGKENVMTSCRQSAEHLKTVTTDFRKFKVIAAGNHVVIDSIADYTDKEQNLTTVSSCDIYSFKEGKLSEITSYCVELKKE